MDPILLGRDAELARLAALPPSGLLVVTGDRGCGKSALLSAAARQAAGSGRRVITGHGAETAALWPLPLLLALRDDLAAAPPAVSGPAMTFLGLAPGGPPPAHDRINTIVGTVVAAAARHRPITIVVDDACHLSA
ncbi:ATP-binding protein [Actinoplanes missouriensis]|nr:ATP-binding protein [Actinoplanes missouriensis]